MGGNDPGAKTVLPEPRSVQMIHCQQCGRPFQNEELAASISGSIMGDEHTDSYFLCPVCGVYTVAQCRDNFTGEETRRFSGPLSKQEGDDRVQLIQRCSEPWDKKCRCDTHRAYFHNTLD